MRRLIKNLLVALVYILAGKLGLRLAFVNASATAVWPPTGIALAALLIYGDELWPGILLGAFVVNAATAGCVATSLGIAIGNTAEAYLGAHLVNRYAKGRNAFDQPQTIFRFTVLAGLLSTSISPTIGVTTLALGGFALWSNYGAIWFTWWLGDMAGALIIAPFLLLWSNPIRWRWDWSQLPELGLLISVLVLGSGMIFAGLFQPILKNYPLDYLFIPLIIWTAYRFGERETATNSVLLLGIAIWGTLHGYGPFVRKSPNESLLLMQTFMMVITLTGLTLATMVSRQKETDMAAQKRVHEALQASEKRYQQLLKSNIVGTMIVDWNGRVFDANDAFLAMTGYTRQDLEEGRVGGPDMTPPEYHVMDEWARAKLKESGVCAPLEKEYFRKDGTRVPVVVGVVFHEEPEQHLVCLVIDASDRRKAMDALRSAYDEMETRVAQRTSELASANQELTREIERRKRAEAALQSLAITDALTGLYNRRGFTTLGDQLLKQARRSGHPFRLFLADLDGLKQINDTLGHLEGDHAINAVAAILKDTFRASDVIARIGGDEFAAAVLADPDDGSEKPVLERLQQKLDEFNQRARKTYKLSISVGTAELNADEVISLEALLAQADAKLYDQKRIKKTG